MSETLDSCIKHEKTFFWAGYILYIIMGLVAIILTGMVLRGGTNNKSIIWALYAFNILAFIGAIVLLGRGNKLWGGLLLFLQFVLNLTSLIMTNNAGNVTAASYVTGHFATTGTYTSAVVLTIISFLIGIPAVYFNRRILG